MLLIAVVSLIVAFSFSSKAKERGYDSPRFWIYPVALGAGINLTNYLLVSGVRTFFGNGSSIFLDAYPYVCSFFS